MKIQVDANKLFFSIGYIMILIRFIVESSTLMEFEFFYRMQEYAGEVTLVMLGVLCLFKLFYIKDLSVISIAFILLITLTISLVSATTDSFIMVYIFMLIFLAIKVPLRSIIKVFLYIKIPATLLLVFLSTTGLILNFEFVDVTRGSRFAFGSVYATDFGSSIFYLLVTYYYFRKTINLLEVFLASIIIYLVQITTDARLSIYLMILATILFYILGTRFGKAIVIFIKNRVVAYIFVISYIFTIIISYLYDYSSKFMEAFNEVLSGRLFLGNQALNTYNIKLFGQKIQLQGHGWSRNKEWDESLGYNYIDSIYLQWTLINGIVLTLILLYVFTVAYRIAIKNNDTSLMLILILLAISGIVDQHILNLSQNPFIFAIVPAIMITRKYSGGNENEIIKI